MIKKIAVTGLFLMLILAFALAIAGVDRVSLGKPFMDFLTKTSLEMETLNIKIPNLSEIDYLDTTNNSWNIAINIGAGVINVFIKIINFVIWLLNTIWSLITFIYFIIKNGIDMKDTIVNDSSSIVTTIIY